MMPSGKLCSRQPKKLYKSQVQSNTRAGFKLTYRENYGKLQKAHLGGGGGGDLINSQLETLDSLSTAVYSVNIN